MYRNVTTLNLSKSEISKLQKLGFNYCKDLSESLLNSLSIKTEKSPISKTALEILEEELINGCILSYNKALDVVLKHEIKPKIITELSGLPGTGKTQICFQLCITVQLSKALGGLEGEAIYINTNKNFASHRLRELGDKFINHLNALKINVENFTKEHILKHIHVFNCNNFEELTASVKYIEAFLRERQIRLIVIDSISNPLREVNPQNRTAVVYQLFGNLQSLAKVYNFAIVVTNDFTTRVKKNEAYYTPSFGDSFFHRVNSRICLSKENDIFYAEAIKSLVKGPIKTPFYMF